MFDTYTTADQGENLFPEFSSGMDADHDEENEESSTTSTLLHAINMEQPSSDDVAQQDEDAIRFPIMQKYGIPINCSTTINALIQELCKLHGGKHIHFSHGNNRRALLL